MTTWQPDTFRQADGFTLLEALVAMAITGMIITILATIFGQWLPNWKHGFERLQGNEHVAIGIDRLVGDLSAAEFVLAGRKTHLPLFEGSPRSVTFVRTSLGPNSGPGLELIRITEVSRKHGPALVRSRAPFLPSTGKSQREVIFKDPVVLLRPPYRLTFSYAGADRVWHDEWHQQPRLPEAVRLTLNDSSTAHSSRRITATLVHARLPVDCLSAKSIDACFDVKLQKNDSSRNPGTPR
jgi:general secretion pathway protein J